MFYPFFYLYFGYFRRNVNSIPVRLIHMKCRLNATVFFSKFNSQIRIAFHSNTGLRLVKRNKSKHFPSGFHYQRHFIEGETFFHMGIEMQYSLKSSMFMNNRDLNELRETQLVLFYS